MHGKRASTESFFFFFNRGVFLDTLCYFCFFQEDVHQKSNNANELSLASVGGVFVVLLAGLGLACITAVGEFMWKMRTEAVEGRVRHDLISSHVPKTKPYDILQKVDLQPPNY